MDYIQQAILATLIYADVFSYPLHLDQLHHFLITKKRIHKPAIEKNLLTLLRKKIIRKHPEKSWYGLFDRTKLFGLRLKRNRLSVKKLLIAKRAALLLSAIPTIRLVGISGGLALNNAKRGDDIDFFVIARRGSLWLTRLFLLLFLERLGYRRRPDARRISNTICINMIIDDAHMALPFADRDLFSAHEVVQMRPVFVRGDTYERFVQENRWVGEFLGNSIRSSKQSASWRTSSKGKRNLPYYILHAACYILYPFEFLAKILQLWYMRKRRTTEVIVDGYLRFHPRDARAWVLPRYHRRLAGLLNRQPTRKKELTAVLPLFQAP